MKEEAEDQVKRDRGGAAAYTEPPQPTRRQLLKGLTTGTVAIGTLSQSGCGPVIPPLKTRGATSAMLSGTWFALSFWVEIGFGLMLPFVLLLLPEVRESRRGLATACGLVIAGVLLHRLNVAVIGLRVRHWESYMPSLGEIGITLGITAGALFVFGWLARILPIHAELP
jgi:hypothetical protein